MESWASFPTFWYSTQGKNPTRTALEFGFLSALQSVQKCSFQQTRRRANSHGTWTVDRLRFFNEPLETWECLLSLWYSTLGWIPLIAMPSLWFLTATRSQVRFDVGAKSLVTVFLVDSTIATNHVVSVAWDGVHLISVIAPLARWCWSVAWTLNFHLPSTVMCRSAVLWRP